MMHNTHARDQVEEEDADVDEELFDDVHDYDYLMMADQPSVDSETRSLFKIFTLLTRLECIIYHATCI